MKQYLKDIIKRIFPNPEATNKGQTPVYQEVIIRDKSFQLQYLQWKNSDDKRHFLAELNRQLHYLEIFGRSEWKIEKAALRAAESVKIDADTHLGGQLKYFLLDHIKDRISSLKYRLYSSFKTSNIKGKYVVSSEKYYFKPILKVDDTSFKQQYGNISAELTFINGNAKHLQIGVTTYAGHNYETPQPFMELLSYLFGPEKEQTLLTT